MQSMKKLLKSENFPSSNPLLESGDNHLHAALSMEARTRSPLPPSPTTSTTLHDIESQFSSFSDQSEKFSLRNPLSVGKLNPAVHKNKVLPCEPLSSRVKPAKPPRKNLYNIKPDKDNNNFSDAVLNLSGSEYETVSKYDEVELRSNAWQTLGFDEIKHTENMGEEEDYISWGGRKEQVVEHNLPKASKVITQPTIPEEDDSYDKLNFFGSSSKLNQNKAGYKQLALVPQGTLPCPPSFNEYDEVGTVLQGVRLADDSHLGYALIRKNSKDPIDHKIYNDDQYAIISKPKRV